MKWFLPLEHRVRAGVPPCCWSAYAAQNIAVATPLAFDDIITEVPLGHAPPTQTEHLDDKRRIESLRKIYAHSPLGEYEPGSPKDVRDVRAVSIDIPTLILTNLSADHTGATFHLVAIDRDLAFPQEGEDLVDTVSEGDLNGEILPIDITHLNLQRQV